MSNRFIRRRRVFLVIGFLTVFIIIFYGDNYESQENINHSYRESILGKAYNLERTWSEDGLKRYFRRDSI
jgi:hypothetical protein